MMTTHDVRTAIEKIDEEIIRLLAERSACFHEAQEEDPESLGAEFQADVVAHWDEAADEHGWNPVVSAKICKAVTELCRQPE